MTTLRKQLLQLRFARLKFRMALIKLTLAGAGKVFDFITAVGMSTINEMDQLSQEIVSDEIMEMIHGDFDPGEEE